MVGATTTAVIIAAGAFILYLNCCCQEHECQSDLRLLRKMAPCTRWRVHVHPHLHAQVHVHVRRLTSDYTSWSVIMAITDHNIPPLSTTDHNRPLLRSQRETKNPRRFTMRKRDLAIITFVQKSQEAKAIHHEET